MVKYIARSATTGLFALTTMENEASSSPGNSSMCTLMRRNGSTEK